MKTVTYEWSWNCLALFRNEQDGVRGGSTRIFTLKPAWLWQYWQNFIMVKLGYWPPDPFGIAEKWLRRNNLWHKEGPAFFHAIITRYANSCPPGEYVRLNPRFVTR